VKPYLGKFGQVSGRVGEKAKKENKKEKGAEECGS